MSEEDDLIARMDPQLRDEIVKLFLRKNLLPTSKPPKTQSALKAQENILFYDKDQDPCPISVRRDENYAPYVEVETAYLSEEMIERYIACLRAVAAYAFDEGVQASREPDFG